jgi:hypothetical protein
LLKNVKLLFLNYKRINLPFVIRMLIKLKANKTE